MKCLEFIDVASLIVWPATNLYGIQRQKCRVSRRPGGKCRGQGQKSRAGLSRKGFLRLAVRETAVLGPGWS